MSNFPSITPGTRTRFRPFWTLIAIAVVFVIEMVRYYGNSPPAERQPAADDPAIPQIVHVELTQDETQPRAGENVTLTGPGEEGVWVALQPESFKDLSLAVRESGEAKLLELRDAGRIARVSNQTRGVVAEAAITHLRIKLLDGERADREVTVDPRFVSRIESQSDQK